MKLGEIVEVMNTDTKLVVVVHNFQEFSDYEVIFKGFEETIFQTVNPEMCDLLYTYSDMNVQNISARKDRNGLPVLLVLVGDEEHYHTL